MKSNLILPTLIAAIGSFFISCEADVTLGDDTSENSEISTSPLSGFLNSEAFSPATTHFTKGELFGDEGYDIKLFQDVEVCDEFQSIGDITFFIASENDLTPGAYEGKGPYFNYSDGEDFGSASYFGAAVIIDEVTDTTISGRVKGGGDDSKHYIEGAFVAELCQK